MKNLLTRIILFIGAGILITSCGHGSLTKRHYRNGYHFDYANKPPTPKATDRKIVSLKQPSQPSSSSQQTIEVAVEEEVFASVDNNTYGKQINMATNKSATLKHNDNKITIESFSNSQPLNAEIDAREPLSNIKLQNKLMLKSATSNDALSLFWLVIMIIIIIWLIAFLGGGWGLGGLINLLLLVALILFILWLLRLI